MTSDLSSIAKDKLRDCAKYALFDQTGAVLAANYQVGSAHAAVCGLRCSAVWVAALLPQCCVHE
jgi:hypothetical protein